MGKWRYAVVLDAGSSGTRAHVYRWPDPASSRSSATSLPEIRTKHSWTKKIKPGVSSFSKKPERVGPDHIEPLLDHVLDVVPSGAIQDTPFFLLATAGMRLLPHTDQSRILTNVCSYVQEKTELLLPECNAHVKVIDGKTEGLYGWIAANYMLGSFDKPEQHEHGKGHHTYGFLDMGGASAQIAFAPNATEARKHANDLTLLRLRTGNGEPAEHKVFVTSWLGFGVREARNRYLKGLLETASKNGNRQRPDPCLPEGLQTTTDGKFLPANARVPGEAPYLVGTGKFDECLRQTVPLLAKDVPCEDEPCLLNGVHVPSIDFDVNHFVGISEYWHTTHEIFEMAHKDKAYDFNTYQTRVKEFCGLNWESIKEGITEQKWGKKVDEETAFEVCFKAAWIINILHDGIGIPRAGIENPGLPPHNGTKEVLDHSKEKGYLDPFQAINKIDSTEVSWALGKAVLYASSQVPPVDGSLPVGYGSNEPGIPDDFEYPASSQVRKPVPKNPYPYTNGTAPEHWHDSLFEGHSRRRIPGVLLFVLIILIALFFLCGRERRTRIYRKFGLGRGRGSPRKRGRGLFLGKLPFFRRTGNVGYERVLEEGARDFELGSVVDSDSDPELSPTLHISKSSPNWGSNHPHSNMLKYALDNSSSHSIGSGIGNHVDRAGLVVRTESRDRLAPITLGPTNHGRKSRNSSPVRHKTPFAV